MYLERAAKVRSGGTVSIVPGGRRPRFTPAFRATAPETVERAVAMLVAPPDEGYAGCCEAIAAMDQPRRPPGDHGPHPGRRRS